MEQEPLTVAQALTGFRKALRAVDLAIEAATVSDVWAVFKTFARRPVAYCPAVQLLFQWGTYDLVTERAMFNVSMVRQFEIIEDDGDYGGMHQLDCRFLFEPSDDVAEMQGNMWSMSYPDLDAFFAAVEQHEVYRLVSTRAAVDVQVDQWEV